MSSTSTLTPTEGAFAASFSSSSPPSPRPAKRCRPFVAMRRRATSPAALAARTALALVAVVALVAATLTTPASAYVVRRRTLLQESATTTNDDDYLSPIISSLPPETTDALSSYLGNAELSARMRDVASRRCAHLGARVYEIGTSVRGQPLVAMSIGHDAGGRGGGGGALAEAVVAAAAAAAAAKEEDGNRSSDKARGLLRALVKPPTDDKPKEQQQQQKKKRHTRHRAHVKYVAGLHGDEPSGRQLLLALAEYICAFDPRLAAEELLHGKGKKKEEEEGNGGAAAAAGTAGTTTTSPHHHRRRRHADPRVAALLSRAVLHLLPSANPDGFDLRRRENAAGVDLNRDFPDPLELRKGVPVGDARLASSLNSSSDATTTSATSALGNNNNAAAAVADFFVGSLPGRSPDPDADDVDLSPRGKEQPETLALMRWMTPPTTTSTTAEGSEATARNSFRFVASAALHEGALVANYPWDGTPDGSTRYAACPDDATFRHLASSYARRSPAMVSGPEFGRGVARPTDAGLVVPKADDESDSSSDGVIVNSINSKTNQPIPDVGTTNGAAWYPLRGGMQDWNYLHASCFELTLELAQSKWPRTQLLPRMFAENLDPLLAFPVVATSGARGVVVAAGGSSSSAAAVAAEKGSGGGGGAMTTTTTAAIPPPPPPPPIGTTVRVRGLRGAPPALPDPVTGAWFRPLSPGKYVLSVAAPGLQAVEAEVEVGGGGGGGAARRKSGGSGGGVDVDGTTSVSSSTPSWAAASLSIPASSPEVEVTLREKGSTARLVVDPASEGADGAADAFTASAVSVPLHKKTTTSTTAATTKVSSFAGDLSAFLLRAALAGGALAALVSVLRSKSQSSSSSSSTSSTPVPSPATKARTSSSPAASASSSSNAV